MLSLRTIETEDIYQEYLKVRDKSICPLCRELKEAEYIREFEYWAIIPNKYPYDAVMEIHDMLVCKRHVDLEGNLTVNEAKDLADIKQEIMSDEDYDMIQENVVKRRTVLPHFHIHLMKFI